MLEILVLGRSKAPKLKNISFFFYFLIFFAQLHLNIETVEHTFLF